jgi:hypothetical protein
MLNAAWAKRPASPDGASGFVYEIIGTPAERLFIQALSVLRTSAPGAGSARNDDRDENAQ